MTPAAGAPAASSAASGLKVVPWKEHVASIKRFQSFPPYPKQQRHVTLLDSRRDKPEAQEPHAFAFSLRQACTQFKLSGSHVEEPVEDMARTLAIVRPTVEVMHTVHEIAILMAEYYDLLYLKRRAAENAAIARGSGKS